MPNSSTTLYVLTGPTAVGKTELSLGWAEQNEAEIVSCDSLLFYRGMDIGTAKPSKAEQRRVPHHLIDIIDLTERMDVGRYLKLARSAIDDIAARGRRPLIVGGSGFYLKSFLAPTVDEVQVPPSLRAEIMAQLEKEGLDSLLGQLRRLNPSGIDQLDTKNPRRVVRALERCRASGRTLRELADEYRKLPAPFADWDIRLVRLEREKSELDERILRRVEEMVRSGLVGETETLLKMGLRENPSASRAIGYRETIALLEGRLTPPELVPTIAGNTRALVKKQRTWFRTQLPAHRSVPADTCSVGELFA